MLSSYEGNDMQLALEALKRDQKLSVRRAAKMYNVAEATLRSRRNGIVSRRTTRPQSCRLTEFEERSIVRYVLDLDARAFPPRLSDVEDMANQLLRDRDATPVGVNWASTFVRRQPDLRTRFNRRIDYQRVLCEDPDIYQTWFTLVRNTITIKGIHEDDIYNFDETGFMMGKMSCEMVVTSTDRRGRPRAVQQGNREWSSVLQAISSCGYAIPPYIILAGLTHLRSWYENSRLPPSWKIAVTKNGWTTNERGLDWIKHFDEHTAARTKSVYRLLILDGHESHHSFEFESYAKEHNIITLCMPSHSSHRLQPLDVGCFGPLKRAYSKEIDKLARVHITHVGKEDFLNSFHAAYEASMTEQNIRAGFRGAGLLPYDPMHVISKLPPKNSTKTPPGSSHSDQIWVSKTPYNAKDAASQAEYIKQKVVQHPSSSPTGLLNAIDSIAKGTSMLGHQVVLLQTEVAELRRANQALSRRRRTKNKRIQTGGSLTVQDAQDQEAQKAVDDQINAETRSGSRRTKKNSAGRRCCRICGEPGHNARTCQNDVETSSEDDSE